MSAANGYNVYATGPEKTGREWFKRNNHKKHIIDGLVESNNTFSSTLLEQSKVNARINEELLECIQNETASKVKVQVLERQLAASREAENRLTEQLRDVQRHQNSDNDTSATLDRHILSLEKEIQKLEFDKDWVEREVQSNVEQIQQLNESIRQMTTENETTKSDNDVLKEEKVSIEKNLIDAHTKVRELELECGQIKGKLKKENKSRRTLEAKLSKLDKTIASTQAVKVRLETETRVTMDLMKREITRLDSIVKKKTEKIRKLQNDKLQLVEYYSTRCEGYNCTKDSAALKDTEVRQNALHLGTSVSDYLRNKVLQLEGTLYRRERLVDALEETISQYNPDFSVGGDPDLVAYLDQPFCPDITSLLMYAPARIVDDNVSENSKINRDTVVTCKTEEDSDHDEAYISMAVATAEVDTQPHNNGDDKTTIADTVKDVTDAAPESASETSVVTEASDNFDNLEDSFPSVSSDTLTSITDASE